jgi:quercetin dioxygenase-like cupin family protein
VPHQPRTVFSAIGDTDVSGAIPVSTGFEVATLWSASDSDNHLVVQVHSIEAGKESPSCYFPSHTELVVCWRGRGYLRLAAQSNASTPGNPQWDAPFQDVEIGEGDTIAIPKGALRRYRSADKIASTDPRDADKRVGKLVLIAIYALNGNPVPSQPPTAAFSGAPTKPFPPLKRNFREERYLKFDRNPKNRAIRSRIWGRDGEGDSGAADLAKASFHLTLYTFVPRQENPGHFHPHSVELIVALQGRAETHVQDKNAGGAPGWGADNQYELREGDTLLVKEAGWHRYITAGNDDCLLLALQTPHPIMHTLKHETNY